MDVTFLENESFFKKIQVSIQEGSNNGEPDFDLGFLSNQTHDNLGPAEISGSAANDLSLAGNDLGENSGTTDDSDPIDNDSSPSDKSSGPSGESGSTNGSD
jgi:hypothetical protein